MRHIRVAPRNLVQAAPHGSCYWLNTLENPTSSSTIRPKMALIFTKVAMEVYVLFWTLNYLKIAQPPYNNKLVTNGSDKGNKL